MGFKNAAQMLKEEIAHLHRRIERVRGECERLRGLNQLSPLREQDFADRTHLLEQELKRIEAQYEVRKNEPGATHRSDMHFNSRGWGEK